jgi:hypothetical protein
VKVMSKGMTRVFEELRLREAETDDRCMVCGRPVDDRDERSPLPGGGFVHRECATYRVRRLR